MKILFDHQIFNYVYGGASKYFAMMINSLPKGTWETTSLFSCNEYVREKNIMRTFKYRFKGQTVVCDMLNRPYTNIKLRRGEYDVFHQTNFGTYCLKSLANKPMVTTYHDANLSTFDPHPEIVSHQKKSLERADAIVCVSENTKRDMLNLFDIDESKVHVIYHGIELPVLDLLPTERILANPYILYVGRRSEYKNFKRFIQSFANIHKKYADIKLVCTSHKFSDEELSMFKALHIVDSVVNIGANEQTMLRLYRDAMFFVFPSLYEGFGMPILESWSCHCPVLLSNASCFPEIAGNAGLYFNPTDVDSIYSTMKYAIEDNCMRKELIKKGDERIKLFSWEKCANEHFLLYKSLT